MAETLVHVEKDDAARLIREAAFTNEDEGRTIIHTFAGGGGMHLGADWDLEPALEFIANADELAWVHHPMAHDLAVRGEGRIIYFDVHRQ